MARLSAMPPVHLRISSLATSHLKLGYFCVIALTSVYNILPAASHEKGAVTLIENMGKSRQLAFLGQKSQVIGARFRRATSILANMGDIHCNLKTDPKFGRVRIARLYRLSQLTHLRAGIDSEDFGRFKSPDPISNSANSTMEEIEKEVSPPRGSRRSIVCQNTLAQVWRIHEDVNSRHSINLSAFEVQYLLALPLASVFFSPALSPHNSCAATFHKPCPATVRDNCKP
jgi:hypothetical protein